MRRFQRDVDALAVGDRAGGDLARELNRPPFRERQPGPRRAVAGRGTARERGADQGRERKCPTRYGGVAAPHTL
jgi:hypothetical protein